MLTVSEGDNVSICVMSNGISGISGVTLNYSIITNNTDGEWVWCLAVFIQFFACIILVGVANNNTNDNWFFVDYAGPAPSGMISFSNGVDTACIQLLISNDNVIELDEVILVQFTHPVGAMLTDDYDTININIVDTNGKGWPCYFPFNCYIVDFWVWANLL